MYRRIVWCYVLVLTLVDISLKTKLTAQGKSHDVNINGHDSLVDGFSYHDEWGESLESAPDEVAQALAAEQDALALGMVLQPPRLALGPRPLGAAHQAHVALTNAGADTLHLASLAGTTPDFHASFFHHKAVMPGGNTSFSVVFVGRRLGLARGALYVQSSRGVLRYGVSAHATAPAWGLWPLLGLRVPAGAEHALRPALELHNPTARAVQVTELYSSAAWLRLALPGGGGAAARERWLVPAGRRAVLATLLPAPPAAAATAAAASEGGAPHAAYVRVRGEGLPRDLLLVVEARAAPAGVFVSPWQLRVGPAGSLDAPRAFPLALGNSRPTVVRLDEAPALATARCRPHPHQPPPLDKAPAQVAAAPAQVPGVALALLRARLEPHQPPEPAAQLTLDYAALWAQYEAEMAQGEGEGEGGAPAEEGQGGGQAGGEGGAWCAGWALVGGAALPYSVHLLPGGAELTPDHLDVVREAPGAEAPVELRVRNRFRQPLRLLGLERGPRLDEYFDVEELVQPGSGAGSGAEVAPGEEALWARLRLRADAPPAAHALDSWLAIHTNASRYSVEVRAYSGRLELEWEWPRWAGGEGDKGDELALGALPVSCTVRVRGHMVSRAPGPLCARQLEARLPGAHLAPAACAHLPHAPPDHACRCVEPGGRAALVLTVVAPARAGWLRGVLALRTPHHATEINVTLRAIDGRLRVRPVRLGAAAPYAHARAPLVLDSSMELAMAVTWVGQPPGRRDPALSFVRGAGGGALPAAGGAVAVGALLYAPERGCGYGALRRCYSGMPPRSRAAREWHARAARAQSHPGEVLALDLALLAERRRLFAAAAGGADVNLTLVVRTSEVARVAGAASVRLRWPALVGARQRRALGRAPALALVGGAALVRVAARNPSRSHALLLQPLVAPPAPAPNATGAAWSAWCRRQGCAPRAGAFRVAEWRAAAGSAPGAVRAVAGAGAGAAGAPLLLLAPLARVLVAVSFAPQDALPAGATLYLRNNLTVLEAVPLHGHGAEPSLHIAGRPPDDAPLLFEVTECVGADAAGGVSRRVVSVRNAGPAPLRLAGWAVAGAACGARGFRVEPCGALALRGNETRALALSFAADYSLARADAQLTVRAGTRTLAFPLRAQVPAALLARCARAAPRPRWEGALRAAGTLLAAAAAALLLCAGALDAERVLRRARHLRACAPPPGPGLHLPPGAQAPLDLRAVAAAPPAPVPAPHQPQPRPPLAPRRRRRKPDPAAESRAFERWRAALRRRGTCDGADGDPEDESRSSEDAGEDSPPSPAPAPAPAPSASAYDPLAYEEPLDADDMDDEASSASSSLSSSPDDRHRHRQRRRRHHRDHRDRHDDHDDRDDRDHGHRSPEGLPYGAEDGGPGARRETPPPPYEAVAPGGPPAPAPPPAPSAAAAAAAAAEGPRRRHREEPSLRRRRADDPRRPPAARRERDRDRDRDARKDRPPKRRAPPATPPRASPPRHTPPHTSSSGTNGGASNGSGAAGVRWGASWSSVVVGAPTPPSPTPPSPTAPTPPPPIGPVARRPKATTTTTTAADHSLFYFNAARPAEEYRWPPTTDATVAAAAAAAAPATTAPSTPAPTAAAAGGRRTDLFGDSSSAAGDSSGGGGGAYGVWGSGAGLEALAPGGSPWGWLRPPPGFAPPSRPPPPAPSPSAPGAPRPFDPFHSLAAIWSSTALDWRTDTPTPPPPPPSDQQRRHRNHQ